MNCGCLIGRSIKETHPPVAWVLTDKGVTPVELTLVEPADWIDPAEAIDVMEKAVDLTDFVDDLRKLKGQGLDFMSAVSAFCKKNGISKQVIDLLKGADD